MSDPTPPPSPPEPPAPVPMAPPPPAPAPAPAGAPVLGIVAVVLAVMLAPIGLILGIITLALAQGRKAAKVLGTVAVVVSLVICGGIAALIVWVVSSLHGAQQVADEFMTDLQRNDVPSAYALTATGFKESVTESRFQDDITRDRRIFASRHHVVSSAIRSSTSIGTFTDIVYAFDASSTAYLEVQLVQENGSWRVSYIKEKSTP